MKKTLLFAAVLLTAGTLTSLVKAQDEIVIDGIKYTYNLRYHSARVMANNYSGDVYIPDEFVIKVKDEEEGTIDREIWVEDILEDAFKNCKDLRSVRLPGRLHSLAEGIFEGCTNLRSVIIPETPDYSAEGCDPEQFQCDDYIDMYYPFQEVDYMQSLSLYIGKNVKLIDPITYKEISPDNYPPFHNMQGLHTVILGKNVNKVAKYSFAHSYNLKTVQVNAMTPPMCGEGAFDAALNSYEQKVTLYVPYGTKDAYLKAEVWKDFTNIKEMAQVPEDEDVEVVMEDDDIDFSSLENMDDTDKMFAVFDIAQGDKLDKTENSVVLKSVVDETTAALLSNGGLNAAQGTFSGIVLKVPAGEGTINLTAKVSGKRRLAVLVEGSEPQYFAPTGKEAVKANYKVSRDSYVYIYAAESAPATAPGRIRLAFTEEGQVDIYKAGWHIAKIGTGVEEVESQKSKGESQKSKVESRKLLSDGRIVIVRDGITYDLMGTEVK